MSGKSTTKYSPTPEQAAAINSPTPCLVSAAAGSGKTTTIAQRVAKILADETLEISAEDVAVVTFTNMAAAEMRERIESEISNAIKQNPHNERLKTQKLKLHLASISTINSFCLKIVREYFYLLGISEDVKIANNADLADLTEQAFAKILSRKDLQADVDFDNLLKILGGVNGLKDNIAGGFGLQKNPGLHNILSTIPWAGEWCEKALEKYDSDENGQNFYMQENLRLAQDLTERILENICDFEKSIEDDALLVDYTNWASDARAAIKSMVSFAEKYDWNGLYNDLKTFNTPQTVRRPKEVCKDFHDNEYMPIAKSGGKLSAAISKIQKLIYADEYRVLADLANAKRLAAKLIDLTKFYADELENLKKQANVLTFADTELLTLKLIAERENGATKPTSIGLKIASELRQVIIDEYQDTNRLQDEILHILSTQSQNLFVVGDVKQSIYAFRQADPTLFLKKADLRRENGGFIPLSKNWRSNFGICDFVNFVFNLTMNENTAGLNYLPEDNLTSSRENSACDVDVHIVDFDDDKRGKTEVEANYIAKYIKDLLGVDENLFFEDFAILMRSKTEMQIYKTALESRGIPSITVGTGNFFETEEIIIAINLLKAINNPADIPLASVMLSPIFAFTAEDLATIKAKNPNETLVNCLREAAKFDEKISEMLAIINDLKYAQKSMDLGDFVSFAYTKTNLFSIIKANDETKMRAGNLLKLMDIAAKFEGTSRSLPVFLRYLEKMARLDDGGTAENGGGNCVKIMTIHASKGLEFTHCILANCAKKFNLSDGAKSLLMSRDYGIGIVSYDENLNVRFNTAAHNSVLNSTLSAQCAEELRVLYVALTRAKKKLTIVAKYDENALKDMIFDDENAKINDRCIKNAKSFNEILLMCLAAHPDAKILREKANFGTNIANCESEIDLKLINSHEIEIFEEKICESEKSLEKFDFSEIEASLSLQYKFGNLNDLPVKVAVGEISKRESDFYLTRPNFMQKEKQTAAEKGTALHEFMQHCDFKNCETNIAKEVERLTQNGFLSEIQRRVIDVEKLEKFFKSDLYTEIKSAKKIWREQNFMLEIYAKDDIFENITSGINGITDEKIVVQGAMDCMIETADGIVIIDYKTDKGITAADLVDRYKMQLNVYKIAAQNILKRDDVRCVIYSFGINQMVELH